MVQKITTIIEVIDKASGKIQTINKSLRDYGNRQTEVTTTTDKFGRVTKKQFKAINGLQARFKMHLLSNMFFGMAIQRGLFCNPQSVRRWGNSSKRTLG